MSTGQLLLGAALIALVMIDALRSTLSTQGGGVVTRRMARIVNLVMLWLARVSGNRAPLAFSGTAAISVVALTWIAGLWLGWWLIFNAFPSAIVSSQTKLPADLPGQIYFVGFTLSTLGVGDLVPSGPVARVLTPVAAFNGLLMATLAITYAIPLVSGSVQKRHFAYTVSSMGEDPVSLVRRAWNGKSFSALESLLTDLSNELIQIAEQRMAYPILDNYQTRERGGALLLQAAVLDDALSLLRFGISEGQRPDPVVLDNVRSAIRHYLDRTAPDTGQETSAPQPPDLAGLAGTGLELVPEAEFNSRIDSLARHRTRLKRALQREGWAWPAVAAPG